MNYVEEQRNELEALSEIYYNEIKVISDVAPISFSIIVRPQASNYEEPEINNSDGEDDDLSGEDSDGESVGEIVAQQQSFSVELLFELPQKYPEEEPSIKILDSQNLEEQELCGLLSNLNEKAKESLGTVMVFMLVSDVVEWLINKSDQEADELEEEKAKKQQEIEAEETKRFEGTPVTVQTFLAWKAKFDAELLKAKFENRKEQSEQGAGTKRLTGRAMFESDKTLAESDLNFVEDLDENQLEALLHNIEEVDLQDDEGEDFELDEDQDEEDDDDDFEFEDEDESDELDANEESKTQKFVSKR